VVHHLPQADIIRLQVERIKRELLRKLGLSSAPNFTGRPLPSIHFLPRPLLSSGEGRDVTDDDEVFPDDEVDYGPTMMSDGVSPASQQSGDYFNTDNDDDYGEEGEEDHEYDDEFAAGGDELGPPAPPPRSKQIIVSGQQRMSNVD